MTTPPAPSALARRDALARLARLAALCAAPALPGCGGGGGADAPPPPLGAAPGPGPATPPPVSPPPPTTPPAATPPPSPPPPASVSTPLSRLRTALARPPLQNNSALVTVTQTQGGAAGSPSIGNRAVISPAPRGQATNPNPATLADTDSVWGHHRVGWTRQRAGLVGTTDADTSWYVPVSRDHLGATMASRGVCALHFRHDGQAFEVLFAGTDVEATLVVDGRLATPTFITTAWVNGQPGARLMQPNAWTRFDFGSRALRDVSLYARSSQGPCALAVDADDRISAWDRSAEPSMTAVTDSYGGAPSPRWGISGPFWEAAAALGIPHLDIDAIGGTGYAPNNTNVDTRNAGNRFAARLAGTVDAAPDLVVVAGGINDNNSAAAPPLYATAQEARQRFDAEVESYFSALRAALPQSVLVALAPWSPRERQPADPVEVSKAETVRAALARSGGPWVFIDNLRGGWRSSSGASGGTPGPWQTGTGHSGRPAGNGNGDQYLSADGVHLNAAGSAYLGARLAADLRAALQTL